MKKCRICGKNIFTSIIVGNIVICKKCGKSLHIRSWKNRQFNSFDELNYTKKGVLASCKRLNVSPSVIEDLSVFFDEYINNEYITYVDGKIGQSIKIFKDYCIITTKSFSKKESISERFVNSHFCLNEEDFSNDDQDSYFSAEEIKEMAFGVLRKRPIRTGIRVVWSSYKRHEYEEEKEIWSKKNKKKRVNDLISVGDIIIDLKQFSHVEMYNTSHEGGTVGFLLFVPLYASTLDLYSCKYFFFHNSKLFGQKALLKKLIFAKDKINENIFNLAKEEELRTQRLKEQQLNEQVKIYAEKMVEELLEQNKIKSIDVVEEMIKYKRLLDEDIITIEEFTKKKKELLNI